VEIEGTGLKEGFRIRKVVVWACARKEGVVWACARKEGAIYIYTYIHIYIYTQILINVYCTYTCVYFWEE